MEADVVDEIVFVTISDGRLRWLYHFQSQGLMNTYRLSSHHIPEVVQGTETILIDVGQSSDHFEEQG